MFSPSVNRTMTAGAKAPRGSVSSVGVGSAEPGPVSDETRFSAVWIPVPNDVPLCGSRRSMVSFKASSSSVGVCTISPPSPKATMPILADAGRRSTMAFCGQLGSVHSRRLDIVGSHAGRHVPTPGRRYPPAGVPAVSVADGPEATARRATAIRKIMGGTCRRRPINAAAPSRTDPRAPRLAASLARFRCKRTYT